MEIHFEWLFSMGFNPLAWPKVTEIDKNCDSAIQKVCRKGIDNGPFILDWPQIAHFFPDSISFNTETTGFCCGWGAQTFLWALKIGSFPAMPCLFLFGRRWDGQMKSCNPKHDQAMSKHTLPKHRLVKGTASKRIGPLCTFFWHLNLKHTQESHLQWSAS